MSKAFTRESEDAPEPPPPRPSSALPPGTPNYMTSDGVERLRAELTRLVEEERPRRAAAAGGRSNTAVIDQRIRQMEDALSSAVVVPVGDPGDPRARLGSWVTVERSGGERCCYRIVGVDEADVDRGWISWLAPIARALVKHQAGDTIRFRFPSGEETLRIVAVQATEPDGEAH
jgi:transcription elongation factor GreB